MRKPRVMRSIAKGSRPTPGTAKSRTTAKTKTQPSRFAPSAFVAASPEGIQSRCNDLARAAAQFFRSRRGQDFCDIGTAFAKELRESGHDLVNFEETEELQEWQATLYHPTGTYQLFLSFRAPRHIEVTYKTDNHTYVAQA